MRFRHTGDQHAWDSAAGGIQPLQQGQAGHRGHSLIDHQAGDVAEFRIVEQLLTLLVGLYRMARQLEQSIEDLANVSVIVDNCHDV